MLGERERKTQKDRQTQTESFTDHFRIASCFIVVFLVLLKQIKISSHTNIIVFNVEFILASLVGVPWVGGEIRWKAGVTVCKRGYCKISDRGKTSCQLVRLRLASDATVS